MLVSQEGPLAQFHTQPSDCSGGWVGVLSHPRMAGQGLASQRQTPNSPPSRRPPDPAEGVGLPPCRTASRDPHSGQHIRLTGLALPSHLSRQEGGVGCPPPSPSLGPQSPRFHSGVAGVFHWTLQHQGQPLPSSGSGWDRKPPATHRRCGARAPGSGDHPSPRPLPPGAQPARIHGRQVQETPLLGRPPRAWLAVGRGVRGSRVLCPAHAAGCPAQGRGGTLRPRPRKTAGSRSSSGWCSWRPPAGPGAAGAAPRSPPRRTPGCGSPGTPRPPRRAAST